MSNTQEPNLTYPGSAIPRMIQEHHAVGDWVLIFDTKSDNSYRVYYRVYLWLMGILTGQGMLSDFRQGRFAGRGNQDGENPIVILVSLFIPKHDARDGRIQEYLGTITNGAVWLKSGLRPIGVFASEPDRLEYINKLVQATVSGDFAHKRMADISTPECA